MTVPNVYNAPEWTTRPRAVAWRLASWGDVLGRRIWDLLGLMRHHFVSCVISWNESKALRMLLRGPVMWMSSAMALTWMDGELFWSFMRRGCRARQNGSMDRMLP